MKLKLTGLLVNIHGFMQLLHNQYFEVLLDHKAIEYMVKGKAETPTTRLRTLLLKLSEYTIDLKYQKGSEMHISDALSRLHNLMDTPDNKHVIPLNFSQPFTPKYIEQAYLYWVDNLHVHKTKDYCHIHCFESKDEPTQMTKQSFTIIYFITFKKTIHFKLICKNVHS